MSGEQLWVAWEVGTEFDPFCAELYTSRGAAILRFQDVRPGKRGKPHMIARVAIERTRNDDGSRRFLCYALSEIEPVRPHPCVELKPFDGQPPPVRAVWD